MRKESIFKKNKELDNSMTTAAFISLIWCIGEDAPLSFLEALPLAGLMTILIHLLKRLIYGRKKIVCLGTCERVYFAGNLDELLAALYLAGLRLKERIGEYYIFTTNYRLLPSDEFVAKEERGYCVLTSRKVLLNYLSEQIDLKNSSTECQINNNSAVEKGQSYSQPCQAAVVRINHDASKELVCE